MEFEDENPLGERTERIGASVVDAGIKVHRALGAGLLESAYQACLVHELSRRGHHIERELEMPVRYEGIAVDCGYRIDLMVDAEVVVELKAVEQLLPIHEAQVLTYLKLSKKRLGLLMNFNTRRLKDGLKRFIR